MRCSAVVFGGRLKGTIIPEESQNCRYKRDDAKAMEDARQITDAHPTH